MPWIFDAASDIGNRDEQQDRMAVLHALGDDTHLLIVADGAGGHSNGALAAQTVIETVQRHFSEGILGEPSRFVEYICLSAHDAVKGLASKAGRPPASTCVFLLLQGRDACWGHVGDSRLYHLRGGQVLFQTVDHSVARLYADSLGVDPDGGGDLPPANTLYMCLGTRREVLPEINDSLVAPDDCFILCSDGFWNHVHVEEIARSLAGRDSGAESAREWVRRARLRAGDGADNISLVLARWHPDFPPPAAGIVGSLVAWLRRLFPGRA